MKNKFTLIGISAIIFFLSSCYYDKEDELYPASGVCDQTVAVTYSAQIVPLFQQYCYNCHGGNAASGGGIQMGTYTADKAIAIKGSLYGSITHASGFSAMPKGMTKLTACQIGKVKKWIDGGSLNN